MPFDGRNRIMIYGPENDGTYIVDPGRYSIRPNCRLPVGATPNDVLGSRLLDYRHRPIYLTIMYVVGSGAPLIRRYRQQYSGATLKRTAGCISSTWSSASRLLPTARRSCSAAVRVTCSRFI